MSCIDRMRSVTRGMSLEDRMSEQIETCITLSYIIDPVYPTPPFSTITPLQNAGLLMTVHKVISTHQPRSKHLSVLRW